MDGKPMAHVRDDQRGQMILILALVFVGLLLIVGLATDGAIVFWHRAQLASRADSAALAGGAELTNTSFAEAKARQYLALHNITEPAYGITITFSQKVVPNDVIHVEITEPVPTAFMRLIGINSVNISAEAEVYATNWLGQQSWSMFRGGPARTGYQQCQGLDSGIQSVQYRFGYRWLLNDGANHRSTPATFQDDRLFSGHTFVVVGSNDNNYGGNGSSADGGPKVYAFDTVTGATLWTNTLGKATKVRSSPLIAIVPGLNSGYPVVYVGGHDGRLYALSAVDGHTLWVSGNDNDDFEDDGLYRSSPALINEGGTYYVYQATSRGNVYKYDAVTGAIVWRSTPFPDGTYPYPNPNVPQDWVTTSWGTAPGNTIDYWGYSPIYGTLAIADLPWGSGTKKVVFATAHGKQEWGKNDPNWSGYPVEVTLFAIDAATGAKLWSHRVAGPGDPPGASGNSRDSAAVGPVDTDYDGIPDEWRVYVAPTDGYLYAFRATDTSGTFLWKRYTGTKHHRSDPVLYCDVVFGGNESGMWALTAADGFSIWDCSDGDGAGPDEVNPYCNDGNYSAAGVRLIPGGVKSAPAVGDGIIMVGANKTASGGKGGSMWTLDAKTGKDLGHWDTTAYNPATGNGLGPAGPPSGNNGDVRSGVVIADDFNAYFGSNDGGLYQVFITAILIIIK